MGEYLSEFLLVFISTTMISSFKQLTMRSVEAWWLDHWHGQKIRPLGQERERIELEAATLVVLLSCESTHSTTHDSRPVHCSPFHACRNAMGRLRHGRRSESLNASLSTILHQHLRSQVSYVLEDWI